MQDNAQQDGVVDNQSAEIFGQTPWQTVGPFFHYCMLWKGAGDLAGQSDLGERSELLVPGHDHLPTHSPHVAPQGQQIEIRGRVLDGNRDAVPDALLELWHADAEGVYQNTLAHFGRCATDADGYYRARTILPGAVTDHRGQLHAPNITIGILARGVIKRLLTRMYFGDSALVAQDPTLELVPPERRATLLARLDAAAGEGVWTFDIVLQGRDETVFFQC